MTDLIRLSQAHLNLLEICPPKFQQVYLDGLSSISHPEQQANLAWGIRFHQLMQQRELGLPITSLLAVEPELENAIAALVEAAPEVLDNNNNNWREAEHCRTHIIGDFLLTVIYDLLIAETETAKIFDWKTYRQPPKKDALASNWQTRLYLYLLAETSSYSPKQISMTYWFVKSAKPQSFTFTYNDNLHAKTQQDLTNLLNSLEQWLATPLQSSSFPHSPQCQQKCPFYQVLGIQAENSDRNTLSAIANIEEVFL